MSLVLLIILTVQRFDFEGSRCAMPPLQLEEKWGYLSDDFYYEDSLFIKRTTITMWVFLVGYFCSCCLITG